MIIKSLILEPILIDSRCLRKGILFQLINKDGKKAIAEISPLPGFSKETLKQAAQQLQELKQRILTTWWTKQSLYYLDNLGLYPSVHFGIASALLDLLDPMREESSCNVYALLLGSPDEILTRGNQAYEEGFREAKIKIGHLSPEATHEIIENLESKLHLRLDLNRGWNVEETLSFCEKYPKDHFAYLEEPAKELKDLIDFPYPFALDESLREKRFLDPILKNPACKALILKPTLSYPINHYLGLKKDIIFTSSFEGPIGNAQIKRLIMRHGFEQTFHGLDTLRYFDYEPMPDSLLEKATP